MELDELTRYNDLSGTAVKRWFESVRAAGIEGVYMPMPSPTPNVRLEGIEAVDGADLLPTLTAAFVARRLAESSAFLRTRPLIVRASEDAKEMTVPYLTSDGRLTGGIDSAAATITVTPASGSAAQVGNFDRRRESFTEYVTTASATVAATAADPDASVTLTPSNGQVSSLVLDGPTKPVTVEIANATTGTSTTYTVNVGRRATAEAGIVGPVRPMRLSQSPRYGSAPLNSTRHDRVSTPMSYQLARDGGIDVVAHIAGILARLLAHDFDRAAIRSGIGGTGQPEALLKDANLTKITGSDGATGAIATANLETMIETLDPLAFNSSFGVPESAGGVADIDADLMTFEASPPCWLLNPATALQVRQLETTTGSGVRWWDAGWPRYLADMPAIRTDDMPEAAEDTISVLLIHAATSVMCRVPDRIRMAVTDRGPGFGTDEIRVGVNWSADTTVFDRTNAIAFVGGGSG